MFVLYAAAVEMLSQKVAQWRGVEQRPRVAAAKQGAKGEIENPDQ